MFQAVAKAGHNSGSKLHLILAGWSASAAVMTAFREGAATFAPGVRVSFIDGTDPEYRFSIWHAADIFASLSDNIQETFGLVILEAMASGLPVVATDWNGYRDLVVEGETGLLVPTYMVQGATADATVRLLTGMINYDHFLAECNQTVTVDCSSTTAAITRLIESPQLRTTMGAAGRRRAQEQFDWRHVIKAYQGLWSEQELERRSVIDAQKVTACGFDLPSAYPAPENSFAGYPTSWLTAEQRVFSVDQELDRLDELCSHPLTNYEAHRRCHDPAILREVLSKATELCRIADLDEHLRRAGVDEAGARATVAWLLKYDLLRAESRGQSPSAPRAATTSQLCFVTTCMGRLEFLQQSLPKMAAQPGCSSVVVDYSCPQNSGDWVAAHFPDVRVVRCPGNKDFHRSAAKNAGANAADSDWICLIDADILLAPDFSERVLPVLRRGECYRANILGEGTGGTIICSRDDFQKVGGHDLNFQGWGEEDDDLRDALKFSGLKECCYSASLIEHLDHSDDVRLQYHEATSRKHSHMLNRMYRAVKWDMARLERRALTPERCAQLYARVSEQVLPAINENRNVELTFEMGAMTWAPLDVGCCRRLRYELSPIEKRC